MDKTGPQCMYRKVETGSMKKFNVKGIVRISRRKAGGCYE